MTFILTKSEVQRLIGMNDALPLVEKAFKMHAIGTAHMPPKVYLTFKEGDLRAMPAHLEDEGISAAGIKSVTVHPGNAAKNLPTVVAATILVRPSDGTPLAFMDSSYLTALRTGASGGVAIKHLANPHSKIAAFIGTGMQAKTQLDALLQVMPGIETMRAYDPFPGAAEGFAKHAQSTHQRGIEVHKDAKSAVHDADIIIMTTPVRTPILTSSMVKPGCHINAIGADAVGKQEIATELVKRAAVVADDWEQASHSGELNVPVSSGAFTHAMLRGSLGEIVAGKKPGRKSTEEITIFDSTGLAIQDIVVSDFVYKEVMKNPSAYLSVNLLE